MTLLTIRLTDFQIRGAVIWIASGSEVYNDRIELTMLYQDVVLAEDEGETFAIIKEAIFEKYCLQLINT